MIQLKIRTEYSFGQTYAPISRIIQRLKELGCTSAGIVDNSTWGHVKWHEACIQAGISPMLGVEVCVSDDNTAHRMWFLAMDEAGLAELYKATSKSHLQQLKTKYGSTPRLYRNDVLNMSGGIIR